MKMHIEFSGCKKLTQGTSIGTLLHPETLCELAPGYSLQDLGFELGRVASLLCEGQGLSLWDGST